MKYLTILALALPLLMTLGCAGFDCETAEADIQAHPFIGYLSDYMDAATTGDATYTTPSDWSSKCEDYYDDVQEAVDEGCIDDMTSADVTAGRALCNM